jgi:hypothetical protein
LSGYNSQNKERKLGLSCLSLEKKEINEDRFVAGNSEYLEGGRMESSGELSPLLVPGQQDAYILTEGEYYLKISKIEFITIQVPFS